MLNITQEVARTKVRWKFGNFGDVDDDDSHFIWAQHHYPQLNIKCACIDIFWNIGKYHQKMPRLAFV